MTPDQWAAVGICAAYGAVCAVIVVACARVASWWWGE